MFITNLFDLRFLYYFYLGTSEFNVGTGPGMPGCSYATDSDEFSNKLSWDDLVYEYIPYTRLAMRDNAVCAWVTNAPVPKVRGTRTIKRC